MPGIGNCPVDKESVNIICSIWRQLSYLKQSSLVQQIFMDFSEVVSSCFKAMKVKMIYLKLLKANIGGKGIGRECLG